MMSYIDLINNFWRLDFEKRFSLIQTRYYFLLLHYANKRHWKEALSLSNSRLKQEVLCSDNGLKTARLKLIERGLISYQKGTMKLSGKYLINTNPILFINSINSLSDGNYKGIKIEKENNDFGEHGGEHGSGNGSRNSSDNGSDRSKITASYIRQDKNKTRGEKTLDALGEKNEKNIPIHQIVYLYNHICGEYLKKVETLNGVRVKNIKKRWEQFPQIGTWEEVFKKVVASDYLSGRNKKWVANFDWLIQNQNNMSKVLEGNYDNFKSETFSEEWGDFLENGEEGFHLFDNDTIESL